MKFDFENFDFNKFEFRFEEIEIQFQKIEIHKLYFNKCRFKDMNSRISTSINLISKISIQYEIRFQDIYFQEIR